EKGRRPLSKRHAADGRWRANSGRFCPPAIGQHRPARADVQGQYEQEPFRADEYGADSGLAHARLGSEHPDARLWYRVARCDRQLIVGGTVTVERYRGDARVQVHGPGFTKILLGDDVVDEWEKYLDMMVDSVFLNSGRGCINCSGIWASRHTEEIAAALAERIGPIEPKPPEDPQ